MHTYNAQRWERNYWLITGIWRSCARRAHWTRVTIPPSSGLRYSVLAKALRCSRHPLHSSQKCQQCEGLVQLSCQSTARCVCTACIPDGHTLPGLLTGNSRSSLAFQSQNHVLDLSHEMASFSSRMYFTCNFIGNLNCYVLTFYNVEIYLI